MSQAIYLLLSSGTLAEITYTILNIHIYCTSPIISFLFAVVSHIIGHRLQITKHLITSGCLSSFAFCFPPPPSDFPYSAHCINKLITVLTHDYSEVNKYHKGVNITGALKKYTA